MRKISVEDLKAGMKVAQKVENKAGMVLLPEGIELTDAHISRLKKWGIEEIFVEGEPQDGEGAEDGLLPSNLNNEDFLKELNYKFEKVLDDPIMKKIYDVVKSIIAGDSESW